jgi:hypothetical protein
MLRLIVQSWRGDPVSFSQGPSQNMEVLALLICLLAAPSCECLRGLRKGTWAWDFFCCIWLMAFVLVIRFPVPAAYSGVGSWPGAAHKDPVSHLHSFWINFNQLWCALGLAVSRKGPGMGCTKIRHGFQPRPYLPNSASAEIPPRNRFQYHWAVSELRNQPCIAIQ